LIPQDFYEFLRWRRANISKFTAYLEKLNLEQELKERLIRSPSTIFRASAIKLPDGSSVSAKMKQAGRFSPLPPMSFAESTWQFVGFLLVGLLALLILAGAAATMVNI
jgi:hypothetical protein